MPRPIVLTPTRHAVLGALAAHQRPVDPDEIHLAKLTGGRVTATLHEMRKVGLLTFTESNTATSKNGHHQGVRKVEITDKGRHVLSLAAISKPGMVAAGANGQRNPLLQAFLDRPISDGVLFKPSGNGVAATGLVDDEKPVRKTRLLPREEAAVAMGEVYTDDHADGPHTHEPDGRFLYPVIEEETRPEFPTPVLDALRSKQTKVQAASALLEEAGLDDEAIRILDALHLSPTEEEYLAFAKAHGR